MPTNLTDRQRFALRDYLCFQIEERCQSDGYPWSIYPEHSAEVLNWLDEKCDTLLSLYASLLGEWPVGYRGQGGWERIELLSKEQT